MPETKKASVDLSRFKVVKNNRGSARGEMLDEFLARLNPSREAKGYKPFSIKRLAMMLSHVPTEDLHAFYKQCDQAGIPFGAYFHWSLKPKKE